MKKSAKTCSVVCALLWSATAMANHQVLSCKADYKGTVYGLKLWVAGKEVMALDYQSAGPGPDAECRVLATPESLTYGFYDHWSAEGSNRVVKIKISDGTRALDYAVVHVVNKRGTYELRVSMANGQNACSPSGFLPSHIAIIQGKTSCVTLPI